MKKILSLTLIAILLLSFATVAYASGLYITSASNSISKSGTAVTMGQTTVTNETATKIKHIKYLQRLVSGNWVTYSTITTYSYGTSSYTNYSSKSVTSGYYYRVKTVHTAYEGTSVADTETRYSGSVYVG